MANENLNLLNFKFGQHKNLASQEPSAGTVYVTTDEQAMYIDLPDPASSNGSLKRIRLGDIIIMESTRDLTPPYSEGAIYYFAKENAMLRWAKNPETGKNEWKQINSTSDVQAEFNTRMNELSEALEAEVLRSTGKDEAHDSAIEGINTALGQRVTTSEFATFKETNSAAIKAAKDQADKGVEDAANAQSAADDAADAAEAAQGTADEAKRIAEAAVTQDKLADAIKDFATDSELAGVKSAILGQASGADFNGTVKGAYEAAAGAQGAAEGAQGAAEAAQRKANEAYDLANGKTTEAAVDAKLTNYYTKTQIDNTISGVRGDTDKTVAQAYKLADDTNKALGELEDVVDGKTTMAAVKEELNSYATKKNLADEKAALLGESSATTTTGANIYDVKRAAAAAQVSANEAAAAAALADGKAKNAQDAADAAQRRADAAHALADAAVTKDELADAIADFATDSELLNAKNAILGEANYNGTVKGAYEAAAAAQGTADDAADAAETAQGRADAAYDLAEAAVTQDELSKAIKDFATDSELLAAKNAILGEANYAGTVKGAYEAAAAADSAAGEAADAAEKAQKTADKALFTDGTKAMGADLKMGGYKIVNLADPTVATDAATKNYVDTSISNAIAANDAMTFKGVLNVSQEDGTTTKPADAPANKGDTYKIGTKGTYAGIDCKVGDLLIYQGADGTAVASDWTHISSGYEDDYLQKLSAAADSNNAKINLSDGVGSTDSSVILTGDVNSNIKFSVSGNTITASMVWGTFDS